MEREERIFKVGEIIRARDTFGMMPEAIYRVDAFGAGMVHLSAGEIRLGVTLAHLVLLERFLPKPQSWIQSEIAVLRQQVKSCGCEDCLEMLRKKEGTLNGKQLVH